MKVRFFYGWIIVGALFIINFATQATGTLNLGLFLIPMCLDIGMSRVLFGWLVTSRALAGGITGYVIGYVIDRFGPRIPVAAASLVTGLCLIGISQSHTVSACFFYFSLIGSVGLTNPSGGMFATVPAAKWFVYKRGTAMALVIFGMGIGCVVFVPITQFFIENYTWRSAWVFLAVISMICTIPTALIFLRRQPEDLGLQPYGYPMHHARGATRQQTPDDEPAWSVKDAIKTKTFWLLTVSWLLSGFAHGGILHRIPYWIEKGFDPQIVSWSISADAAAATIMIPVGGFLLDRLPSRFIAASTFIGFALSVVLMLFTSTVSDMFISTIINGISVGVILVCQTYMWARYFGRAFLGGIRGITMPAILVANAMGTPTVGYIYEITGSYRLAWMIIIALYIAVFCLLLTIRPPRSVSAQ